MGRTCVGMASRAAETFQRHEHFSYRRVRAAASGSCCAQASKNERSVSLLQEAACSVSTCHEKGAGSAHRVAGLVDTSLHWLYFSCKMSRLDRLICGNGPVAVVVGGGVGSGAGELSGGVWHASLTAKEFHSRTPLDDLMREVSSARIP
eukprot:2696159-Pleurochrysis_carterae.AAC.3